MRAGDSASIPQGDNDAVVRPLDGLGTGAGEHTQATAFEDVFQHSGGVRIFAGEDLVTAGDEGDLGAETVER